MKHIIAQYEKEIGYNLVQMVRGGARLFRAGRYQDALEQFEAARAAARVI